MMMKKYDIEVRKPITINETPAQLCHIIKRVLIAKQVGNFNPIYCRYKGKLYLVNSVEGDLSDPFRRDETYLTGNSPRPNLYIELEK